MRESDLMESPKYVRLSTAADITLGFSMGRFHRNARLYCINLLLHYYDGCEANCLYCGQAREISRDSACKSLIRVAWPLRKLDDVIDKFRSLRSSGLLLRPYRFCVATITNRKAIEGEIEVIRRLHRELDVPISALISPTIYTKEQMEALRDAGTERIGIAIDCATPKVFTLIRGERAEGPHRWRRYLEGTKEAIEVMGRGKVGIHLIIGLGETEKEAVQIIQWAHDVGAETHLFSFYPEEGTALSGWARPPVGQYRRIQSARYLIDNEVAKAREMRFNEYGQITDFGVPLDEIIMNGEPFITSGCPGCNRPYANERPGEIIRNYPFLPHTLEIPEIKRQCKLYLPPYNTKEGLVEYLRAKGHGDAYGVEIPLP